MFKKILKQLEEIKKEQDALDEITQRMLKENQEMIKKLLDK